MLQFKNLNTIKVVDIFSTLLLKLLYKPLFIGAFKKS